VRFYRAQTKGIKFSEMVNFNSGSGADDEEIGLAVSGEPSGLDGGSRFGGALDALNDDDEIIVLEGTIIEQIYDGYRIQPTREVARFTVEQWMVKLENETAYDYE
jgi:hypothetical protein